LAGSSAAEAIQLASPALGVPMAAGIDIVGGDHDQVPRSGPDHMIAPGTAVLLLTSDLTNLEPGDLGPVRGRGSGAGPLGCLRFLGVAPVTTRHRQGAPR